MLDSSIQYRVYAGSSKDGGRIISFTQGHHIGAAIAAALQEDAGDTTDAQPSCFLLKNGTPEPFLKTQVCGHSLPQPFQLVCCPTVAQIARHACMRLD